MIVASGAGLAAAANSGGGTDSRFAASSWCDFSSACSRQDTSQN